MLHRSRTTQIAEDDNPFALSIGDLMAALLLIFVLLLSATLLRLEREFGAKTLQAEQIRRIVETYKTLQNDLYDDLLKEFEKDLQKWQARIDRDLSIRFREPSVFFGLGDATVRPEFESILADFFPRYIALLTNPKYKENIEEIRIEGHTSSEWTTQTDPETAYFNNMRLSQDRTRSVLEFCLGVTSSTLRSWTRAKLTANGLSSSKLLDRNGKIIIEGKGSEDKNASRRVEFRIRTNAEKQIGDILNIGRSSSD